MRWKPRDSSLKDFSAAANEQVTALARGFRKGKPEAVREVRGRVARILAFRGYGIPVSEREDLEQEIMTQIWQSVRKPDFDVGPRFWGFVEMVTARRCIDWLRTRRQSVMLDPDQPSPAPNPLQSTMARERTRLALAALAELPKPCRDLVFLHAGLNKSYKEIALILGKSEGALRIQMFRCIRQARRILDSLTGPSRSSGPEEKAR